MRKVMTIITQILIFTVAWFVMTPDVAQDNTYLFGLIGSYDIIPGNTQWVLLGAAILSIINLWVWWPRQVKVTNTSNEKPAEGIKSAEAKEIDRDPKTPDLS